MADPRHQALNVARVYAGALLGLAEEVGAADAVLAELEGLEDLLGRLPELASLLANPLVDEEAKARLLEEHLRGRAGDLVVDCLQVMNRKGRLGLVRELVTAYRGHYEEARGILGVRVVTAVPLTDAQRREIAEVASRATGSKARLEEAVDPALIGGMVLYAGDKKLDASLRRRVEEVGERLLARTASEMHQGGERYVEAESET
ncbi:MAG: ATP synthase F1 subunit delta [Thermoanaerobaculia bacterium]